MKKIILLVFGLFLFLPTFSHAVVNVKGYYRSNGTYVAPHVRSNPNGLKSDNYSYTGGNAYNPSYYTSTTPGWQTSTTITDPYYYAGLSAYNSNTTVPDYMTPGYSSNTYTAPSTSSTTTTSNTTKVKGGYTSYGMLFCDSDYYESNNKCLKAPSHSTAGMYSFYCDTGYQKDKKGESCLKIPTVTKTIPYVVKLWVDNFPNTNCKETTFLRLKERAECETYIKDKSKYKWTTTTLEFDGKHYLYNPTTEVTSSCSDGLQIQYINGKATDKCIAE